jgi:hypothetical protein
MKRNHYSQRPDFSFEGQLLPSQRAAHALTHAPVAASSAAQPESNALLMRFAQFLSDVQSTPYIPSQGAVTREARNDDVLILPTRRVAKPGH